MDETLNKTHTLPQYSALADETRENIMLTWREKINNLNAIIGIELKLLKRKQTHMISYFSKTQKKKKKKMITLNSLGG
jgi:hypothetical protein